MSRTEGPGAPTLTFSAPEVRGALESYTRELAQGSLLRIGRYEVIRELGSGGMGVVFLARDDRLGRKVALKLLQSQHPEFTQRFIIEARATALCSHENIVVIHEVGEHQGSAFMVLEYLQGQTLGAFLKKSGLLTPSRAVELMVSVVKALACAHEQGIVHRDLKPENIFLTDSGTVKVLDFGIAKVQQSADIDLERSGTRRVGQGTGISGTPLYMSPEQWGVAGPIDHRTDIWTTGLILIEALSGRQPVLELGNDWHRIVTNMDLAMPSAREFIPHAPIELIELIDRCLRKRKEERPADALTLLRALEPFLPGRMAPSGVQLDKGPYTGLRSFQEEDASRFFGRDREIAAMASRIREYPLMAAVGPSGIGKSSFVRAGVVPALKGSGENWEVLVARPGREPLLSLAILLAPLVTTSPTLAGDLGAQRELAERLLAEPGYFGSALRGRARRSGARVLVFLDQFEELYTLSADPAERRAFTACLAAAADDATSPVRVVLSIRSDFLDRVVDDAHFMNELSKGLFFLKPPSAEGLRDALVRPAEHAGYRFESEAMVQEMVQHLEAVPGALPLLQFTAAQLWETRDAARRLLSEQSYRRLGGISGALVTHADRIVAKLPPVTQRLCRALFLHLITPERTRAVRSLEELNELLGAPVGLEELVDHLVASRLLVQGSQGSSAVEIVHESLISSWPMLSGWLDESHEDSLFVEQISNAARQWQLKRKDSGLLWGGDMADELARFERRHLGELPEHAQAFVAAVLNQRSRSSRRKRRLMVAGVAAVVGLLASAAVALVVIRGAQKHAENSASVATRARADAERRLREVEDKERERQRAEVRRRAAEEEVMRANQQVKLSNTELMLRNAELRVALDRADELRRRAEAEQERAQESEGVARQAQDQAQRAARRLEELLEKERTRTERLSAQLGSPLVEVLH
ncbi:MAG: protein kinase domain-containing protein [Myxococcota bacterium]